MSSLVVLSLSLCLLSIGPVLGAFFCKDSVIDSIAYANDAKMYFIASGGNYWWIKETGFPPKDSDSQPIKDPFKKTTAAVYIDGDNGCPNARAAQGMKAKEKQIWVTEIVGGKQKLMAYDTKYGQWGNAIGYDEDHCISKARIDFNKPIDAMFTRNYLEIFLVQGNNYAMVDCKFLCSDPENKFGDDKQPSKTEDFGTKDPINGMILMAENKKEKLLMFQKKVYFVMEVQTKQSINGKLIASKVGTGKDTLTDFLRLKKGTACTGPETPPPIGTSDSGNNTEPAPPPEVPKEAAKEETVAPEPEKTTSSSEESGSGLWIIIVIIVIILIVVAVGLCLLFAMRSKKTGDAEAPKAAAEEGVASTPSKSGAKIDSKVSGSKASPKDGASPSKPDTSSKVGSTMSTRSGIGKSTVPKSSAGAVKSSASKK